MLTVKAQGVFVKRGQVGGLLIACGGGGDVATLPPLEPGEKLGEMAIVANHFPSPHVFDFCEEEELASGTCQIPSDVGNLDIIWGWESESEEELNAVWQDSNWALLIDGRQVNLPAFGYVWYDEEDPASHYWPIALQHPTLGKHTVVWTYKIGDEPHEENWTFTITDDLSVSG